MAFKFDTLLKPLNYLNNHYIRSTLLVILIILASGVVPMMDAVLIDIMCEWWMKIIMLLIIIWVSHRDVPVALIIGITYVMILCRKEYFTNSQMMNMALNDQLAANPQQIEGEEGGTNVGASEELDQRESMTSGNGGPIGFNATPNCIGQAGTGGDLSDPCRGVGTFSPDLNAQGLNTVLGYTNNPEDKWATVSSS